MTFGRDQAGSYRDHGGTELDGALGYAGRVCIEPRALRRAAVVLRFREKLRMETQETECPELNPHD